MLLVWGKGKKAKPTYRFFIALIFHNVSRANCSHHQVFQALLKKVFKKLNKFGNNMHRTVSLAGSYDTDVSDILDNNYNLIIKKLKPKN